MTDYDTRLGRREEGLDLGAAEVARSPRRPKIACSAGGGGAHQSRQSRTGIWVFASHTNTFRTNPGEGRSTTTPPQRPPWPLGRRPGGHRITSGCPGCAREAPPPLPPFPPPPGGAVRVQLTRRQGIDWGSGPPSGLGKAGPSPGRRVAPPPRTPARPLPEPPTATRRSRLTASGGGAERLLRAAAGGGRRGAGEPDNVGGPGVELVPDFRPRRPTLAHRVGDARLDQPQGRHE